jgi:hypothetical protein
VVLSLLLLAFTGMIRTMVIDDETNIASNNIATATLVLIFLLLSPFLLVFVSSRPTSALLARVRASDTTLVLTRYISLWRTLFRGMILSNLNVKL